MPAAGLALVFDHTLLHEGALLKKGVKYAMRTDVMFRAVENVPRPLVAAATFTGREGEGEHTQVTGEGSQDPLPRVSTVRGKLSALVSSGVSPSETWHVGTRLRCCEPLNQLDTRYSCKVNYL